MIRLFIIFVFLLLISCGSTKSLTENNLAPFAIVTWSDSTTNSGQLITDDEKHIVIMCGKSTQIYKKTAILNYNVVEVPSEQLMMRDMVFNVSRIAYAQSLSMIMTFTAATIALLTLYRNN